MLTSGTGGGQPPPIPYIPGERVKYFTLRVQFYANQCNDVERCPNGCNSTLMSVTGGTYPHPDTYIYKCSLVVWNVGSPCNLGVEDTHICTVSSTSFPGLY